MSDGMNITEYLARGGKLTSPRNVPPRYRAELMRIMASFVDSELAGAAGFADIINDGPGIKARIAAARIVLEKTDHAERILQLLGAFGADTERYAAHHPWTDRLDRDAPLGAERGRADMRLAVFNYPLDGWTDAVTMNLLMGTAMGVQLAEYADMSYQPMAEALRDIAPREARHAELAEEGLAHITADQGQAAQIGESLTYWWPRVASSFGNETSKRFDTLRAMGLRKVDNAALRRQWGEEAKAALKRLGLAAPADA